MKENDEMFFLALCFISGFLEIGLILLGVRMNLSIPKTILLGFAYQIGNLTPNPLRISGKQLVILSYLNMVFIGIYMIYNIFFLLFISIVMSAIQIQMKRSINKDKVSTTKKRIFRCLGFLLVPMIRFNILIVISILLMLISRTYVVNIAEKGMTILKPKINSLSIIMIVHQIHYFSYTYFLLLLISHLFSELSVLLVSLLFVCSWIPYISVPHLIKKGSYKMWFVAGHSFLGVCLFTMLILGISKWIILPWILTGLGGGTVFCIEAVNENLGKSDIVFAENIGHVLGIGIGLVTYMLTSSLISTVITSLFSVVLAIILMLSCKKGIISRKL